MTTPFSLTDADRAILTAAMDRLIPPVDDLAGAGAMGLAADVERMAEQHARYALVVGTFVDALSAVGFDTLGGDAQDQAIARFEAALPIEFYNVLEVVYLAYYSSPAVHARIGWRSGPLQPRGFELPPFDESVLETTRQRRPFWRQAPS